MFSFLHTHSAHNFTTEGDSIRVSGLYAESGSPVDREAAYRLFLYPDAEQEMLLTQLIGARHELATTCDFPTYAHRYVWSDPLQRTS